MTDKPNPILGTGLVAGCLGYATIVAIFAAANLLAGRSPFHTAAVLGGALFQGVQDPSRVTVAPSHVLAYNGLHLLVFLLLGLVGSWLASIADRGFHLWFVALFWFLFIAFHLTAAVQGLATPLRSALPNAAVWAAGLAASVVMAAYLVRVHPGLRRPQSWSG
jgi:hypothetical protein